ncbi:MAG: gas vesicle protein [Candidatus Electryoneaceae bacterium]|nr:gas vesicle protein [Candidatus Electryoneaceae bacterium]
MSYNHLQEDEHRQISRCEVLNRVLNKGVVIVGEVTISVANVELIYLGLNLILTSTETMRQSQLSHAEKLSEIANGKS